MYDFLLVINTNLPPILHRFGNTAFKCQKSLYLATPLTFPAYVPLPTEEFPWNDRRKIFSKCECQLMDGQLKVSNGIKILPKILTRSPRTNVTDDRQTDGRAIAYSERKR